MKGLYSHVIYGLGLSIVLWVFFPVNVFAEVVGLGIADYDRKGAESAMNRWVEDGPLEGTDIASQHVDFLKNFESEFGSFRRGDIVQRSLVGNSVQLFYLVLAYERKPLFARFIVFKTTNRWIITEIRFDPEIDTIFHENLMLPRLDARFPSLETDRSFR